jgi:hypothetical protein
MRAEDRASRTTELPHSESADEAAAHASLSGMDATIRSHAVNKLLPQTRRGVRTALIFLNILIWIAIMLVIVYTS